MKLSHERARAMVSEALRAHGYAGDDERHCTNELVYEQWRGCASYGLANTAAVLEWIRQKQHDPRVARRSPSSALIEGGNTPGPAAAAFAMDVALDLARTTGLALVGIRNDTPAFAATYQPRRAAREGFVALSLAVSAPRVAPFGAAKPILGRNPVAAAFPHSEGVFSIDLATTEFSGADIRAAQRLGIEIPRGLAVTKNGTETTDPEEALQGALTAFGGSMGSNLAILVELVVGSLVSAKLGTRSFPTRGMVYMLVDPDIFGFGSEASRTITGFLAELVDADADLSRARFAEPAFDEETEISDILVRQIEGLASHPGGSR